jgi:hypothetical protein
MTNQCACNFRIALAALFTVAVCTSVRAQFTTVAYDRFNFGARMLAGTNNDISGASLDVRTTGLDGSGLSTLGGTMVSHAADKSISILSYSPGNVNGVSAPAKPVTEPGYASVGVIGATLAFGWLWRKPTRRVP